MNFHQLLRNRESLLRQAQLANVAFAYQRLQEISTRVHRAGLTGEVTVRSADPSEDRFHAELIAHQANASVVEEHFLEEDISELADLLGFLSEVARAAEYKFDVDNIDREFLPLLRRQLLQAGIDPGPAAPTPEDSNRRHS